MASFKHLASGGVQIRITNRLLPKTLWATFDTETQARAYADHLEALLAQGIVPTALLDSMQPKREVWLVTRCIAEYRRANVVPRSDVKLLDTVEMRLPPKLSTDMLNYDWAEAWITGMKRKDNLAPSTIRHRHGALSRCLDWMVRKHSAILPTNPLRLLKRGFAAYTAQDAQLLADCGKAPKIDEERDRRVLPHEEKCIRHVLLPRADDHAFFTTALESGMRMRECYTLELPQVSFEHRTFFLQRTKNGDRRQVPMSTLVVAGLSEYIRQHYAAIQRRGGRLFPYWSGERDDAVLEQVTRDVSRLFADAFAEAGLGEIHFHDLRHEFICRLYERTKLTDVQIARITGHRDPRQLKRYASLRGSDLAPHLW
ncbi:site-specific integrase [Duganella sp. BuS-21]|uniref:site-specific integrase n=1 Tax=Duganella sp. BuS-21 TaxID=2943848 RepID=UPI0035A5C2BD